MNSRKWLQPVISVVIAAVGLWLVFATRATAIAEDATLGAKFPFVAGLILKSSSV